MKEIFVLGAGASNASVDAPLGRDLVWTYYLDCFIWDCGTTGFSNYEKFLNVAAQIYPELSEESQKFQNTGLKMYVPYPFFYRDKKYYVDEILRLIIKKGNKEDIHLIRSLIAEHIFGKIYYELDRSYLYQDFVDTVLKTKDSQDVSIISFNFDSLLTEYNFAGGYPISGVYFDYLINFDGGIDCQRNSYKKQNAIPMIKLNGSLDWGICQECNKLRLYFPAIKDRHFYDYQKCKLPDCNGKVEPLIIMPHEQYPQITKVLWDRAKEELSKADKVTIIGYSFPDYDQKVRCLFMNALNDNVEIEVIDYCGKNKDENCGENKDENQFREDIRAKYEQMFPQLKKEIKIDLSGFQGYIKYTMPNN